MINVAAIVVGTGLGILLGSRLPEKLKQTVVAGMGLFTLALGLQMFMKTQNALIVLGSLVVGGVLGEWAGLEDRLASLGSWLEARFNRGRDGNESTARFVRGFMTASLVYCIGPIAVLGSIQDGLTGDYSLLAVKSVLDGFASLAFASTLGIGVGFSAVPLLAYQGGISLLAGVVQRVTTDAMIAEMTATGGVILMGVAISGLLEIKKIRSGNFLPALLIAPVVVAVLAALGN